MQRIDPFFGERYTERLAFTFFMEDHMRKLHAFLCAFSVFLLFPVCSQAKQHITLFPDSAQIQEKKDISPSPHGRYILPLPAGIDQNSLHISLIKGNSQLKSLSFSTMPYGDSPAIKALRDKIAAVEQQISVLQNHQAGLHSTLLFWRNIGSNISTPEQAKTMAASVAKSVAATTKEISALAQEIRPLRDRLARLNRKLKALTGGIKELPVAVLALDKPGSKPISIEAQYRVTNCGWSSLYSINAHPEEQNLSFLWQAQIYQNSGLQWNDAELTLSTAQYTGAITPPPSRPWILGPRQKPMPRAKSAMENAAPVMFMAAPAADSVSIEQGELFDAISLGTVSLNSGQKKLLTVRKDNWDAKFDYLIRPQERQQAFLHARVDFKSPLKLPYGPARLLIDSSFVQQVQFGLSDKKTELFFGPAPQIRVDFALLDKKSGSSGVISKKSTARWQWKLTVENQGKKAASIRVEDALPQLRDSRISMDASLDGAKQKDNLAVWTFELDSEDSKDIEYGYTFEWPKDMEIHFGGR